jgi:hypothetical protein
MFIQPGVSEYNKGSIVFDNGSSIVSSTTTGRTGRGKSPALLYVDELSFVEKNIQSEFWSAIQPAMSAGGKIIVTSTPKNADDQFGILWHGANKTIDDFGNPIDIGQNGFKAFSSTWDEHPERGPGKLMPNYDQEQLANLGEEKFRREILCEFITDEETLINQIILQQLEAREPLFKEGQIRWYKKPVKGMIYVLALDPSMGTGGDPAAIEVYEANTLTQVAEWRHNKTDIPNQIRLLAEICRYINGIIGDPESIYYSLENNSVGEGALISLAEYGEHNIPAIFISEIGGKRKGFNTNNRTKSAICTKFKSLVENRKLTINSKALISELKTFVATGGSYAAKKGDNDDLVMSSCWHAE